MLDFPAAPANGQRYLGSNGVTYTWQEPQSLWSSTGISSVSPGALNAADFGFVPSAAGATNSAAFVTACTAAMAAKQPLLIGGGDYLLDNTTIRVTLTASLTIICQPGLARFVGANLTQLIFTTADGVWTSVSAITAVDTPTTIIPRRTRLTVASTAGYSVGSYIGIVSNDRMDPSTASSAFFGEPALVDEVDAANNWIYTVGELVDATKYVTTPSIRQFDRHKLTVSGITMAPSGNVDDVAITARAHGAVWVRGCYRPEVEVHFENAYSYCLTASWCWHGKFTTMVDRASNATAANGFGYGGSDYGGNYGNDWTVHAERCRHAFTTGGNRNVPYSLAGEDVWWFGGPKFSVVRGVASHCYAAAWDTHGDSFGTFFEHVTAQYDASSPAHFSVSVSAGVQLRGRRERIGTAVVYGSQFGVRLSAAEAVPATSDQDQYVYVDNVIFTGGDYVFTHAVYVAPVVAAAYRYRLVVGSVKTDKCERAVFVGAGGWTRINHLDCAGMTTGIARIDDGGYLDIENGVFDYTPEARTTGTGGISLDGTSACDLACGRVIGPALQLFNRGGTAGTKTTRVGDVQSTALLTFNDSNAEWALSRLRAVSPSFDHLWVRNGDSGRVWQPTTGSRAVFESAADCIINLVGANTSLCRIFFSDQDGSAVGRIDYDHSTNQMAFYRNGSLTLTLGAGFATFAGRIATSAVAVSGLGSAASAGAGARWWVTDATQTLTAGIGTVVAGGGANSVPVVSDGTSWRIA